MLGWSCRATGALETKAKARRPAETIPAQMGHRCPMTQMRRSTAPTRLVRSVARMVRPVPMAGRGQDAFHHLNVPSGSSWAHSRYGPQSRRSKRSWAFQARRRVSSEDHDLGPSHPAHRAQPAQK
jgi:hypothetical protein